MNDQSSDRSVIRLLSGSLAILFIHWAIFSVFVSPTWVLQETFCDVLSRSAHNTSASKCLPLAHLKTELDFNQSASQWIVTVENGSLSLAINQPGKRFSKQNSSFLLLNSKNKFHLGYGKVKWQTTVSSGQCLSLVLWLSNTTCRSTLDALDLDHGSYAVGVINASGESLNIIRLSVLFRLCGATNASEIVKRYADILLECRFPNKLLWTRTTLAWLVNGEPVYSLYDSEKIPLGAMYKGVIVTDFCMEGSNDTSLSTNFLIDCVTVRQENINPTAKVLAKHRRVRATDAVFRDDFDGETLDSSKWRPISGILIGNKTYGYLLPGNVIMNNGTLRLIAGKEASQSNSESANYTSGSVNSMGLFSFTFGEVEWKAKSLKGNGIFFGLYLTKFHCGPLSDKCHNDFSSSISALNARGDTPTGFYTYTCKERDDQQFEEWHWREVDMTLDYHVYKLIWTKTAIVWILDDEVISWTTNTTVIPVNKMQINMGTSVMQEVDDSTIFPVELLVDYVIVRQGNVDPWKWIPGNSAASTLQSLHETSLLVKTTPLSVTASPNASSDTAQSQGPQVTVIVVSTVSAITLLILVSVFVYLYYKRKTQRRPFVRSVDTVISLQDLSSSDTNLRSNDIYAETTTALRKYIGTLEIPLANLEIGETLGQGEYGIVRKGTAKGLKGHPLPTTVAIKSGKNQMNQLQRNQLIQEMKIMTKAGRHLNIINLLGTVVKGEILLLLEYCEHGSLLNYLNFHRGIYFYNQISSEGKMLTVNDAELRLRQQQVDRVQQSLQIENTSFDGRIMSTSDLLNFAFQISRGMNYLNSRSIIHRDLAARNVLVCQDHVVKIADFGLAKQMPEYVLVQTDVALPVRWMPPESMMKRVFNQKSDVWSFGVLMWEIFSLGETPYTGSSFNTSNLLEFLTSLCTGMRLERPSLCPASIYSLMLSSWTTSPNQRPEFAQLEKDLTSLIGDDSAQIYLSMDLPYQQFNLLQQNLLDQLLQVEDTASNGTDTSDYLSVLINENPYAKLPLPHSTSSTEEPAC
ncbi:mast/stem cell growth factor receptor Kit-like [Paramacrobiotus metropolitanus]|uniref:mast/stem cell growth factor receptor Kit-like n=1 Tax=Paramacrobiotus metropolitanus TaxID=2943436 RepID=UPI002445C3C0|nr:mast/stem cell growth factor receptor Kit-like [Paramacrobiotus metropolitanus]